MQYFTRTRSSFKSVNDKISGVKLAVFLFFAIIVPLLVDVFNVNLFAGTTSQALLVIALMAIAIVVTVSLSNAKAWIAKALALILAVAFGVVISWKWAFISAAFKKVGWLELLLLVMYVVIVLAIGLWIAKRGTTTVTTVDEHQPVI